jgi:hypothetical protein
MAPEESTELIQFMYREWRSTLRELMAYQALMNTIALENPTAQKHLELALERVMLSPELADRLDTDFEGFKEVIAGTGDETVERLVLRFQGRKRTRFPVH